ncbi:MIP/aquaporin family protein [Pleurotus pulmonarius]
MHLQSTPHFSALTNDFHAAFLEFVGTFLFLLLGLGGIQTAQTLSVLDTVSTSDTQRFLYISTSMGLSLLVSAWLFLRITGGVFNPNVSLSLMLVGAIRPVRCVLFCVAQLVGGIAAAAVVRGLTDGSLRVNTALAPQTSPAEGVFIEMFITSALVLSVLMLATERHQATPFAPVGIGLTLFSGHLFAVYYTGASMNTARSFGPAVVTGFPDPHHWVYWVGPLLGSLLGSGFYSLLKHYRNWVLVMDERTDGVSESPRPKIEHFSSQHNTVSPRKNGFDALSPEKGPMGSSSSTVSTVAPSLDEPRHHGRSLLEIRNGASGIGVESDKCPV